MFLSFNLSHSRMKVLKKCHCNMQESRKRGNHKHFWNLFWMWLIFIKFYCTVMFHLDSFCIPRTCPWDACCRALEDRQVPTERLWMAKMSWKLANFKSIILYVLEIILYQSCVQALRPLIWPSRCMLPPEGQSNPLVAAWIIEENCTGPHTFTIFSKIPLETFSRQLNL